MSRPRQTRRAGQVISVGANKWKVKFFLGADSDGQRHYYSKTLICTKKEAEQHLRQAMVRHQNGEPLKLGNETLNSFLDEFLTSKSDLKRSVREHYENIFGWYVRPTLGKRLLTKITADDVQKLYAALAAEGYAPATISLTHTLLVSVFKLATRRRKVAFNPMEGVNGPSRKRLQAKLRTEREERVFTAEQIAAFLQAASSTRLGALFALAFHYGCRPGELLALKWEDFNAQTGQLQIKRGMKFDQKLRQWYTEEPKTPSARRTLTLTPALLDLLDRQRATQLTEQAKAGRLWRKHGFIFTDEIGEPYHQRQLRERFKAILKQAELPEHFTPYAARHTVATHLIESGADVKSVAGLLGHAEVSITLNIYTHLHEDAGRELSGLMERKINQVEAQKQLSGDLLAP